MRERPHPLAAEPPGDPVRAGREQTGAPPHGRLAVSAMLLTLGIAAVLVRLSISPGAGRELWPGPDAVEYAETARRLASFQGAGLEVSGVVVPSRYPVLFPLLLVPVQWMGRCGQALSAGMALLGGISTLLAAVLAHKLTRSLAAGVLAGGIVLASPAHIAASHFVMSDLAQVVLLQLALLLALHQEREEPRPAGVLLAGLIDGALVALRTASLPLTACLALYRLLRHRGTPRRIVAYAAGVFLCPLLEALNRVVSFGSPLRAGYEYYVPSFRPGSDFHPLAPSWIWSTDGGTRVPNLAYFGRLAAGLDGALIGPPIVAFLGAGLGVVLLLRRPPAEAAPSRDFTILLLVLAPLGVLLLQMMYYWQEARMLLAWTPMVAVLLAVPIGVLRPAGLRVAVAAALLALPIWNLPRAMHQQVPRAGLSRRLAGELQALHPDVVVTNLGVLRTRSLLFPTTGPPLILSLTDSIRSDEHVFRNMRQPPIPPGPFRIPVLATWSSADHGGSGTLDLDERTLDSLERRRTLFLFLPDEESRRTSDLLASRGWTIRPAGSAGTLHWGWLEPRHG